METGQNKTTESGKIRFYIMGLIYRYGNRSVQVPSSVELAERFGVARRTARLALEGLVREGWLIGRRGLGTFTNPARAFFPDSELSIPLVGLIYGKGDNFYYDTPACRMFSQMGLAAAEHGFNTRFLTRMCGDWAALFDEIRNSNLDGLLWASSEFPPPEMLGRIRELGVRVVTIDREVPGFSGVLFSDDNALLDAGKLLAREGRRRVIRFDVRPELPETVREGIVAGARAAGFEVEYSSAFFRQHEFRACFSETVAAERPDAVIVGWMEMPIAAGVLAEQGIDPVQECRVITMESSTGFPRLPCARLDRPYGKAARAAVEELARLLNTPDAAPQIRRVDVELTFQNLTETKEE